MLNKTSGKVLSTNQNLNAVLTFSYYTINILLKITELLQSY